MRAFQYVDLLRQQQDGSSPYLEFLRVESLSMGLYILPAGSVDGQEPHTEDEVYYVAAGQGYFYEEGERRAVKAGDILFVPAKAEHRFYDIEQDLHIFVFFAPAEYSQQA
jgi:quercetin dioxygenase-like cupin family protein